MDQTSLDSMFTAYSAAPGDDAGAQAFMAAMDSDLAAMPVLLGLGIPADPASAPPYPAPVWAAAAQPVQITVDQHAAAPWSSTPAYNAPPAQHSTAYGAHAHISAPAATSVQPQGAAVNGPQAAPTHSAPVARAQTAVRRGHSAHQDAPAARRKLRNILPKPAPPSSPISTATPSTSAAPSPCATAAPLFAPLPKLSGRKAPPHMLADIPATATMPGMLLGLPGYHAPPAAAGAMLAPPSGLGHASAPPASVLTLPVPAAQMPAPPMPAPPAKRGPARARAQKKAPAPKKRLPAPPPAAVPKPGATSLQEGVVPQQQPAPASAESMAQATVTQAPQLGSPSPMLQTHGTPASADPHAPAAGAAGVGKGPAPSSKHTARAAEPANRRKRSHLDTSIDMTTTKRTECSEAWESRSALDLPGSSAPIGHRVQSSNNTESTQRSHALQIAPPPQRIAQAASSTPVGGNNPQEYGRPLSTVPRAAAHAPAQRGLCLPLGGGVHHVAGAEESAPALTPAPAPAPAPAALAVAPSQVDLPAGEGVRGTTVVAPTPMKRTDAASQPGPPSAPAGNGEARPSPAAAGPSHSAGAPGIAQSTSAGAAQSSGAVAGPSRPPAAQAQGEAATADEENGDGTKKKKKKKSKKKKKAEEEEEAEEAKRVAKQATNSLSSIQAGLKWCSWMTG